MAAAPRRPAIGAPLLDQRAALPSSPSPPSLRFYLSPPSLSLLCRKPRPPDLHASASPPPACDLYAASSPLRTPPSYSSHSPTLPSSPEEEASSSPEEQEHPSSRPLSPELHQRCQRCPI
ncbi:proline-rich receptor-like protein kinase PERK9 [Triticum aestivum]|uniref:proline-rich receptor-like protein kinase PERK9 n=1 Tax=Triticum aestivum TaxID=4565 RepID=UPI001D00A045|nr:proline-rich receptor-like protein kinase PERK9 [Triticum aestivum]